MLQILHKIGFAICHQLPERSFFVGGEQLPLCSRCTGIYLGIFITLTFYFFTRFIRHKKPSCPPHIIIGVISIIFVLLLVFNALSPLFNIPTNNILRFITGIFFGMSLPLFLIPAINYSPKSSHDQERIINTKEYLILVGVCLLSILAVIAGIDIIMLAISYLSIAGLLLFILLVNTAIISLLLESMKRIKTMPYYYSLLAGSLVTGLELYLFSYLHIGVIEKLMH
jgi:uncharacterized membrane protein